MEASILKLAISSTVQLQTKIQQLLTHHYQNDQNKIWTYDHFVNKTIYFKI